MRKLLVVLVVTLAFGMTAFAQDAPRFEVFGGYQYTNLDVDELNQAAQDFLGTTVDKTRFNLNGWNAAATAYFSDNFGITADFSGAYGSPDVTFAGIGTANLDSTFHTYMFGPTIRVPGERSTVFARALFGGAKGKFEDPSGAGLAADDSGFAMALGGGFDVNMNPNFAIRVAQFDYLYTKLFDTDDHQNNFRYSGGVVFRF